MKNQKIWQVSAYFPAWQKLAIAEEQLFLLDRKRNSRVLQPPSAYCSCLYYLPGFWKHLSLQALVMPSAADAWILSPCSRNPGWTSITSVCTSFSEDFLWHSVPLSAPQQALSAPPQQTSADGGLVHKYPNPLSPDCDHPEACSTVAPKQPQ